MLGHNRRMTGAECLADMLAGYGVTHVFMVPAVLRRTFAEMERRTKIARVHCHGEKSAAYMADGYARASGKPGICMAQVIGALNLAAGLRDAYLAHSPVIAMTGGRDPKTKFRKVYQEIDDVPAFEPVTKFNATIDEVARIPDMVRQAFRVATSGAPGPVHLQFRGNEGQVDLEEAEMEALVEAQFARVPPFRPEPEAAHVKAALDLLQKAERPIFVAGGGVRASGAGPRAGRAGGSAANSGRHLAQRQGLHPRHASAVGRRGRQLFARKRQPRGQPRRSRLFHRQRDRRHDHAFLGGAEDRHAGDPDRHRAGIARPQLSVAGERAGRRQERARAHAGADRQIERDKARAWIKEISALRGDWYAKYKADLESDSAPIHPARICGELTKHVPDDGIVVVDTGHAGMWMGGMYDLRAPTQSYMRSAGHLGWAFPAGIGAKAACPDRPVVVFTGDAGFWYHIAEVETAVRWKINSVTVVNNNGGGNQSKRGFDRAYGGEPDRARRANCGPTIR